MSIMPAICGIFIGSVRLPSKKLMGQRGMGDGLLIVVLTLSVHFPSMLEVFLLVGLIRLRWYWLRLGKPQPIVRSAMESNHSPQQHRHCRLCLPYVCDFSVRAHPRFVGQIRQACPQTFCFGVASLRLDHLTLSCNKLLFDQHV